MNDDYTSKFSLKCKKPAGPVAVTIETERSASGALSSKVGTKFGYAKLNVDKGQIKSDGSPVLETSLKVTPDVSLSFKSSKGADLGVDYKKGGFYGTASLDVMDFSSLSASGCYTSGPLKVGGDAKYKIDDSKLGGFSLGAGYSVNNVYTSVTTDFGKYNLGLLYKVNDSISLASSTSHSSSKICEVAAVGGAYKSDLGLFKAKYSGSGVLSASFVKEIAPKVSVTASGSMTATDPSTFKPGIAITM